MPVSAKLIARSGDLKQALVKFASQPRFNRFIGPEIERRFGTKRAIEEAEFIDFLDTFILKHRLPDGRTPVEIFAEEYPRLTAEERAMLRGWRNPVEGVFEIERRESDALETRNLVDQLAYRVRSNMGAAGLAPMQTESFLVARVVPIGDEWLLSGQSSLLPIESRDEALLIAAELASKYPALVFRNPEKVAEGWELQREEHRYFIDFFGSDVIVIPGREVDERMREYAHYRRYEVRDDQGRTPGEKYRETYGVDPPELNFQLPPEIGKAETVGVLYDELDGLNFLVNYGRVRDAFVSPDLVDQRRYREAVLAYLEDASIPPRVIRRLAEIDEEKASTVFQRALRTPDFSWERDGEALLRRHKAAHLDQPPMPSVTPMSEQLARAQSKAPRVEMAKPKERKTRRLSRRSR